MKRLLTPPSTASTDGPVVESPPALVACSRKRIRLSRLSIEGRVDWILDLHVPPGGTVTCFPGSSLGNLRVEELQEHPLVPKQENQSAAGLSPTTNSSDDSSSNAPSSAAARPFNSTAANEILQSLTTTMTPSAPAPSDVPSTRYANSKPAPDRAVIVVSAAPPAAVKLKAEPGEPAPGQTHVSGGVSGASSVAAVAPPCRSRAVLNRGAPLGDARPHMIKTMPVDGNRLPKVELSHPPKYLAGTAPSTRGNGGNGAGHNIKPRSSAVPESAPKSRVHFTSDGSIPVCRMPNCARSMYFYKNEDRWRCNLNRGGCGAVFHNVGQDIGPCSKCQRPVADGDPCYDWCVCRYCSSAKRQSNPPTQQQPPRLDVPSTATGSDSSMPGSPAPISSFVQPSPSPHTAPIVPEFKPVSPPPVLEPAPMAPHCQAADPTPILQALPPMQVSKPPSPLALPCQVAAEIAETLPAADSCAVAPASPTPQI
eukprot:Gregarina_sp_Pseudo_9__446@NODE_1289_length_1713_cov_97_353047_g1212_i0_p1_GENE_NODE_1289_length_1713_cov_97_353047_g1212_i0NODE_1289_length_1713_cov_97_353047_g1212_i0_p1_ORF_typecomplete_len481_score75_55RecR/PF02132_15/0_004_NODE_1289_length_1713_cov_97_353047_g1212_i01871629